MYIISAVSLHNVYYIPVLYKYCPICLGEGYWVGYLKGQEIRKDNYNLTTWLLLFYYFWSYDTNISQTDR